MTDNWDEESFADPLAFEEEETARARAGWSSGANLRRQHQFHLAAQYVATALSDISAVERVVLFGSVALPLKQERPRHRWDRRAGVDWVWHECGDVDLAVWIDDLTQLKSLQRARGKALNFLLAAHGIGVAHHQVELFIMEPGTDRYLGRLCTYATCPKGKEECRTPGCGEIPILMAIEGFTLRPEALHPAYSILLYDREEYPLLSHSVLLPALR